MRLVEKEAYKRIPLEILLSVTKFCDENKIKYSLAYGTLLGAVRHKGYIPWDDDIDIYMPRADYEKFRSMYLSQRYPLVDLMSDVHYPIGIAKVYDSTTIYYYKKHIRRNIGLFIDVFVIDNIPSDVEERKKWLKKIAFYKFYNSIRNASLTELLASYGWKRNLKICFFKLLPIPSYYVHKKLEDLFRQYNNKECEYVGTATDTRDYVFKREYFDSYIDVEFENHKFKIISSYHDVLSILYGDYMSLPPEKDRKSKHDLIAYYI